MGIRFLCPNGHKLNVKSFLAGKKAFCPVCGTRLTVPQESTAGPGRVGKGDREKVPAPAATLPSDAMTPADAGPVLPAVPTVFPTVPAVFPTAPAVFPTAPVAAEAVSTPTIGPVPAMPVAEPPTAGAPAVPMIATGVVVEPMPVAGVPPPPPPDVRPDALAEAPDAVWYVRPPSGGQYGPATTPVMRGWIQEGRVSADSLVWREGWRDWLDAGNVFAQLNGGDPAGNARPAAAPATAALIERRRRSGTLQAVVIALLIVAVIVFGAIFAWVLLRQHGEPPSEGGAKTAAAKIFDAKGPIAAPPA